MAQVVPVWRDPMFNRREFIEAGFGTTLLAASLPGIAAQVLPPRGLPYREVIVDRRFPVAAAFGALLHAQGAELLPIEGDTTDLWSGHLRGEWRREPHALAGMTLDESLFTLQLVAQDAGLRLMYCTEHSVPAMDHDEPGMALAAASALLSFTPRQWSQVPARLGPALTGGRPGAATLIAWVMAPRASV
jgi:hypothetical protein